MAGTMELEREQHNAQIQERYRKILQAEESQFDGRSNVQAGMQAQTQAQAPAFVSAPTYYAPVANVAPVMYAPEVKEYPSLLDSPVFTGEKYANLEANYVVAPVKPVQEVKEIQTQPIEPVMVTTVEAEPAMVESFSLNTKAKMMLGAVCATFVLMFSLVGFNTQVINQKAKQIKNLEKARQQLMEKNEELQTRIEKAQSEDSIREYALSQGMIQR